MSFSDLADKISDIRMKGLIMLAKAKYRALAEDVSPFLETILIDQGQIDKLNILYDKIVSGTGDRTAIFLEGREAVRQWAQTKTVSVPQPPVKFVKPIKPKKAMPSDDFPYHRLSLDSFDTMANTLISQRMERDKDGSPSEWHQMGKRHKRLAVVVRTYPEDSTKTDIISDWEVEPTRIRCKETDKDGKEMESPKEAWEWIKKNVDISGKSPKELRELVYQRSRGCNLFNITLGIYLLTGDKKLPDWQPRIAGGGDVLDPASGWGDRLGASFIAGAKSYTGWDTNSSLQPVYSALAERYSKLGLKMDWSITPAPFETADLKGRKFDTVLTSPPFFTKELYQGSETSTTKYNTKQDWLVNYYQPMWRKAVDALRPGGRVIAYISNGWMFTEANKTLKQEGLEYRGAVGFLQSNTIASNQKEGFVRDSYVWVKPVVIEKRAPIAVYHSAIKRDILSKLKYSVLDPERPKAFPRILDLSCGRGGDLPKYIELFGSGTKIVGVDIDSDAIDKAIRRMKGADNIKLIVQDLTDLSESKRKISEAFGDGEKFDFIVCNFAVHYFYKSEQTLDNFVELVNYFSKPSTINWFTFPDSERILALLKKENPIRNETYELSAKPEDMKKEYNGKLDFKLVGTKYFETAEPGEKIITSGTSHEYFADPALLINKFKGNSELNHFDEWEDNFKNIKLSKHEKEISYANVSVIIAPEGERTLLNRPKSPLKPQSTVSTVNAQKTLSTLSTLKPIANLSTKGVLELLTMASKLGYTGVRDKAKLIEFLESRQESTTAKKTYLAMLEWLDKDIVASILEPMGYKEVTYKDASTKYNTRDNCVDIILVDGEFTNDKRLYGLPAHLKGRIDSLTLNNKVELHKYMNDRKITGVTADTIVVAPGKEPAFPKEGGIWIWRPEGGWSGEGVHVVDSAKALKKVWQEHTAKRPKSRALISRYIMNPLLTADGYKFHVRIHLLVVSTPQGKRAAIYKDGIIVLAKSPYKQGDYSDHDIHDTHIRYQTPRDYPAEFPGDVKSFDKQVLTLLKTYFDSAWDDIKWYAESDGAFELYGCDFMMDTDGRVYLIEINSKPGLGRSKKAMKEALTRQLIGGLKEFALENPMGSSGTKLKEVVIVARQDTATATAVGTGASVIEPLSRKAHYTGLSKVTSDRKTMERVGNGRTWDEKKLERLFEFEEKDTGMPLSKRKYISYVIKHKGEVKGLLQFHPSASKSGKFGDTDERLYITIFIHSDSQRQGLASRALYEGITLVRQAKKLASFGAHISKSNEASIRLHEKLGFKYEALEQINGADFMAFALPPPFPAVAKGKFILDLENMELPEHSETLKKMGFKEMIKIEEAVKIGGCEWIITHGAMATDKRLYNIVSLMLSRLDAELITNKVRLHTKLQGVEFEGNPIVAKVSILNKLTTVPTFNDAWIWRPEGGWAGKGITIGKGADDLKRLFEQQGPLTGLLTKFETSPLLLPWRARDFPEPGHPENPNPVVTNPERYPDMDKVELRKFHLRVYIVIIADKYGKRMGLYKGGHLICFGDTEFIKDKFDDVTMHNTRLRGYNVKLFPDTFEGYSKEASKLTKVEYPTAKEIMRQLEGQFKGVAERCMPGVRPYAESHYGFEILGCDVMVNNSGKTWIIEMNKKHATFKMSDSLVKGISHNLYGGLFAYLTKPGDNEYITEVYFDNTLATGLSEIKLLSPGIAGSAPVVGKLPKPVKPEMAASGPVGAKRFSQKIINESQLMLEKNPTAFDYSELWATDVSDYSSLMPWHIPDVDKVLKEVARALFLENMTKKRTLFDATAHIGADTILFARYFNTYNIIAGEIDPDVHKLLVLNTKSYGNVKVLPAGDSAKVIRDFKEPIDLLFLDPPWLGDRHNLRFGGVSLSKFVGEVINKKLALYMLVKLPHDTDLDKFRSEIKEENNNIDPIRHIHPITEQRITNPTVPAKLSYYLVEISTSPNVAKPKTTVTGKYSNFVSTSKPSA